MSRGLARIRTDAMLSVQTIGWRGRTEREPMKLKGGATVPICLVHGPIRTGDVCVACRKAR